MKHQNTEKRFFPVYGVSMLLYILATSQMSYDVEVSHRSWQRGEAYHSLWEPVNGAVQLGSIRRRLAYALAVHQGAREVPLPELANGRE